MKKTLTVLLTTLSLYASAQCIWPKVYNSAKYLKFQFTFQGDILGQISHDNFSSNFNHTGVPTTPPLASGYNESCMKYTNGGTATWVLNENYGFSTIYPFANGLFFLGSSTNRILDANGNPTGPTFPTTGFTYHTGFTNQLLQFNGTVLNAIDVTTGAVVGTSSLPVLSNFSIFQTYVKGTSLYLIGHYISPTVYTNTVIIKLNQPMTTAEVRTLPYDISNMAVTNSGVIYLKAYNTSAEIGTFNWSTSVYSSYELLGAWDGGLFEYDELNTRMIYFNNLSTVKFVADNGSITSFPITATGLLYTFPLSVVDYFNNELLITASNSAGSLGGTINGSTLPYLSTTSYENVILHKVAINPPVASFTASTQAVCPGNTVTFTSTSTGGAVTYNWSFPGGTPSSSTLANPVVLYCTPGTYNVSLTVSNCAGVIASTTSANYIGVANTNCASPVCTGTFAKRFGAAGSETMLATKVDANGNIYTTGRFTGTVDFDPGAGVANLTSTTTNNDIFITKFDAIGNFIWVKQLAAQAASTSIWNQADELVVDNFGNIVLVGTYFQTVDFDPGAGVSNLTSGPSAETFILKLSSCGELLWVRRHNGGGAGTKTRMAIGSNNFVYLAGLCSGTVTIGVYTLTGAGNWDGYVACIDNSGTFLWANRIGSAGVDYYTDIAISPAGNLVLTGLFQNTVDLNPGAAVFNVTSAGSYDVFVMTLTTIGNFVWAKRMGSTGDDAGRYIVVTSTNDIVVVGDYSGTVDFDPNIGVQNSTSAGGTDIFIVRLNSLGNYVWKGNIGSGVSNYARALSIDAANSVYLHGDLNGTLDVDPTVGVFNMTSSGGSYVTKVSSTNTFLWGRGITNLSYIAEMTTNAANDLIISGGFYGTADLDINTTVINATSAGGADLFVTKYCAASVLRFGQTDEETATTTELPGELVVYPNPAADQVFVSIPAAWGTGNLIVYNSVGQVVVNKTIDEGNTTELALEHLTDGLYFISFTNSNYNAVTKLLKTTK